jgi:hypothetical protein
MSDAMGGFDSGLRPLNVRLARLAQNNLRADREQAEIFAPAARPLSVLVAEATVRIKW